MMKVKKKAIKDYIRTVPDYPIQGINFYDLNSLFAGPMFRQAMKELKKILWKGTGNWDSLLLERAESSGKLVLSDFTRNAIAKFKG